MTEERSFNKLNRNLHQDVLNLWDECFGDLPIVTQRLLKAYGAVCSKKAYTHHKIRTNISYEKPKQVEQRIFDRETCFNKDDVQTKQAQALVDKILKKMSNIDTQTSKFLKDFLKDKEVVVTVDKGLSDDACFGGFNPESKKLYIELNAGCFYHHTKNPNLFNEASIARTVGHEIGHAVEQISRSSKTTPNSIGYSSNSWEVESFCDAFGSVLALQAGYSLSPSIEKMKMFEDKDEEIHKEIDPHPTLKQRRKLAELIDRAFPDAKRELSHFSEEICSVNWDKKTIKEKEVCIENYSQER
ncbi:MAG: hypothetical protein IKW39_00520 [Alphaproteobacteria bacterium]|nr:hypothetical protein [Alphaproteobacteria bacterium]